MEIKTHEGIFLKRLNRFVAEVLFQDKKILVYVPNTGSLRGLLKEGNHCALLENQQGKFSHTLCLIEDHKSWVGIHTQWANQLVKEFYQDQKIQQEVKILDSRIDFKINETWIEVKNVTWREGNKAMFPDALSLRARKHLETLYQLYIAGEKVLLFFCIQREDVQFFSPAQEIDPLYYERMKELHSVLPMKAYKCQVSPFAISIHEEIPFSF